MKGINLLKLLMMFPLLIEMIFMPGVAQAVEEKNRTNDEVQEIILDQKTNTLYTPDQYKAEKTRYTQEKKKKEIVSEQSNVVLNQKEVNSTSIENACVKQTPVFIKFKRDPKQSVKERQNKIEKIEEKIETNELLPQTGMKSQPMLVILGWMFWLVMIYLGWIRKKFISAK
ncbi:hypothetical protein [Catellicoccus marimammalium]|uniref:Uncharacterized protein n=1 Tax=Catellicoccus marimammalium M35/04/3 TaxID=1234409 RepID=K8Z7M5_9ENTE|nr:hypothetical protein [Catellicoccus marimammalium]EKU26994.1 hypothetical protein C683_0990 [Catellicoccus marimammalium M35/04/3]